MKTIAPLMGLVLSAALVTAIAQMPRTPAPEGAEAYFQTPLDGDVVTAPFIVRFGLRGVGIAPAGVELPNTGHHHLLVDLTEMPSFDLPLPATDTVIHFGLGQTETELDLEPGEHTLQLVLGDHLHTPHDPPVMSEVITILVE